MPFVLSYYLMEHCVAVVQVGRGASHTRRWTRLSCGVAERSGSATPTAVPQCLPWHS